MKKIYSPILLAISFLLVSCNSIGNKDTIVARVGNETLYAEDLDFLALQNIGDPSSEKYRIARDNLFFSLAKLSKVEGESGTYDSVWKAYEPVVKNRLLTIVYTRYHMKERLGYSDEELKKYFEDHRGEFDSAASYIDIRKDVAGRYYVFKNQDSLRSFIQRSLSEKDEPAKVELSFFEGDSIAVSEMGKKLNEGIPEDSLETLRQITVFQGKENGIFADSSVIKALFLEDSLAVGTVRDFQIKKDSSWTYMVLKIKERKPAVKAKAEDYAKEFEKDFIAQHRSTVSKKVQDYTTDLGSVVIEKLVPKDPQKFYEDNKDKFMTVPGYVVYHVAMKDSAVLAKTMANVKDLESFKAVAATISEKEETSENYGYVGHVKKDFALPYGIGMMPALWKDLEGKSEGYISSAIRSMSDSLYHCFYISAIVPSVPKPFDRVEKQLEDLYASDVASIDLATVLVSKDGKPLYTKTDLLKIFRAEPGIPYNKETHYSIVKMLAQAYAVGERAVEENVDRSWEFRALMRLARMEYINALYDRTVKKGEPVVAEIPENLKKFEYFYNKETKYNDRSYEEAGNQVTSTLESRARAYEPVVSNMGIWDKTNVFFYDRSKAGFAPVTTGEGFLALGDSLVKKQKFDEAFSAYRKVIDLFAGRDTLFRTAVYNLAQAYSDAQKYNESVTYFEAFLQVWPDAPETEKVLFSLGFVLSENLKKNDRALEVLEDLQKRFPKSELKESVDWLVENIKSNGKLADDLMKKIEAEE